MDGRLRKEDRRQAAGDPAQRQPVERPDVRRRHADDEEAARPRLCRAAHALGADLRSHPDARATARRTRRCRPTTSSPTSNAGTRAASAPVLKTPDMLPREYAREAFKRGLQLRGTSSASTRSSSAWSARPTRTPAWPRPPRTTSSARWSPLEPSADPIRFDEVIAGRVPADRVAQVSSALDDQRVGPGGRLGDATTRAKRCGTRWRARRSMPPPARGCMVRVFGGFDFAAKDLERSRLRRARLPARRADGRRPEGRAGRQGAELLIRALRDADGANLDRVQVIKGWLDAAGKTHEKVYDVAWSGGRKPGKTASCRRWATRSTSRTRATPTPSARRTSPRTGRTRPSTRSSAPSTTCA